MFPRTPATDTGATGPIDGPAGARPPHPARGRLLRSLAVAGLSLSLVGGLAACGDDDEASPITTTTTAAAGGYQGNPNATVSTEVCDALVAAQGALHQAPREPDAMGPYLEAEVSPHTQVLVDGLDGELAAAARTVHDSLSELGAGGDPSILESPELTGAQTEIGAALHDGCDWATVDLTAREYDFQGVPDELPAGRYGFALENVGVEEHEMVLFRRNDGVTESFEELAELGDAMMEKVSFTGVAFGGPDTTSYAAVDLEPGTYFLVCFIPVGGGQDGPPHFLEGMQATLEVV